MSESPTVEWNDRMPWVPGNRWDLLAHRDPEPVHVSVIVTHYDQPVELARTLDALAAQDYPTEMLEVIVADDGSPDEPVVPAGVRLVRQDDRGFRAAAARNLGVEAAAGEVLCFLDADTTPERDYVRKMVRLPTLLPEAVTVGRRRHADLSDVPPDAPIAQAAPARELDEPAWLRDAYTRSGNLLDADDRSYRYVISAVLACSRRFFAELGGFDESFSTYGGEDWEWAHRAWQAGAVFAHVPDAVAWHDGPDWAGRESGDRRRAGNEQALRLASQIPVDGSAGRGLLPAVADLEVRLPPGVGSAAAFVCVDSVLAAFPRARVVTDAADDEPALSRDPRVCTARGDDVRVVLELNTPVVVLYSEPLVSAVALLGGASVGAVELVSPEGVVLGRATSRRAFRRRRRWGTDGGHDTRTVSVAGTHVVGSEPHVEAWVGGWGGADRFS